MGWKCSLIIIENKENLFNDLDVLNVLGRSTYQFKKDTTLVDCMYPSDESINIGLYKGNIIICDDYQITSNTLESAQNLELVNEEKRLVKLFPNSEIVQVACHSAVNYHGYSLITNGVKKRLKIITSDDPVVEFGERIAEEKEIYEKSYIKDSIRLWKDDYDPEEEMTEDQLMEDFTFGIAKRRLGVLLDDGDSDELLERIVFKKYVRRGNNSEENISSNTNKDSKWSKYGGIILILIIIQVLKMIFFSK